MEFLNTTLIRLLSKVTGGDVIIDSYMKNDISIMIEKLESYGISIDEIKNLFGKINEVSPSNSSFADSQNIIVDMYIRKCNYELSNGLLNENELDEKISNFDSLVVHSKEELVGLSNDRNLWNMNISFNRDIYKTNTNVRVETEPGKIIA